MQQLETGSITIGGYGANLLQTISVNFYTNSSFIACKYFESDLIGKLRRVTAIVHGGTLGTDIASISLKDHLDFDYFLGKFANINVETEYDQEISINNIAGKSDLYILDKPYLYISSSVVTYGTLILYMEPLV